jgi:hypothetical protein
MVHRVWSAAMPTILIWMYAVSGVMLLASFCGGMIDSTPQWAKTFLAYVFVMSILINAMVIVVISTKLLVKLVD